MENIPRAGRNAVPQEAASRPTCVGVNIGAITVKVVALRGADVVSGVKNHQGRPLEVLDELLAEKELDRADWFGVSAFSVLMRDRRGRGLEAEALGCDGIIIIGPFNRLAFRVSEAILETPQHPAWDACPDLRERRLCGLAVGSAAGGRPHPAGP